MMIVKIVQSLLFFILGAVFGNVCTTLFYRIPRGIPINGIEVPPMCSSCGKKIKAPYYIPFIHVIIYGFKTKCCNKKIPKTYFFIELAVAIFCVLFFTTNPIGSFYIIKFFLLIVISLSILLYMQNGKFYDKINWVILTLSIIKYFYEINIVLDDFLISLFTQKLVYGIVGMILIKTIFAMKKVQISIQEVCFFVSLVIGMNVIMYAGFILSSVILFSIFERKKGIFILPLFILMFF